MAKVHNNIFVRGLTGAVGDQFVIRRTKSGRTIVANKPVFDENREFSHAQKAQQEAFRQATGYAKVARTQPVYVEMAKGTDQTPYNMAMADWFGQPEVLELNTSAWTGQSGQTVQIRAQDDTKVTRVEVVIHNNGTILEQGEAVRSEADGLLWTYITTTNVPTSPAPRLNANAYDMAGNFGAKSYQLN
jgi:hypothetical protein